MQLQQQVRNVRLGWWSQLTEPKRRAPREPRGRIISHLAKRTKYVRSADALELLITNLRKIRSQPGRDQHSTPLNWVDYSRCLPGSAISARF